MQNTKTFVITTFLIIFISTLLQYSIHPLPIALPRHVPVETFPKQFASWRGGDLEPVDPDIQKKLSTAKIAERSYTDPAGDNVDLLLLTATLHRDFHNTTICLPSQGWEIYSNRHINVCSQPATIIGLKQGSSKINVLYWYTGYYPPRMKHNLLTRYATELHDNATETFNPGMSLFVRLIANDTPAGNQALMNFAAQAQAPIRTIVDAAKAERNQSPNDNS